MQVKIWIPEKFYRPLKGIAKEHGIGMSDLFTEMSEWVLSQEKDFCKDLKKDLPESEEDEEEEEEDEEEEGEVDED